MQSKLLDNNYQIPLRNSVIVSSERRFSSFASMAIALVIILLWFVSWIGFLSWNLANFPWFLVILAVWLRAFLHTGLFIVVHDSIHGVVCHNKQINNLMGHIASGMYAMMSYKLLAKNHRIHHQDPASDRDPDFCPTHSHNFWFWYGSFMKDYQEGKQFWILFWGMTVVFYLLIFLQVAVANIFLFWVLPIIISSLQLFTFGIYLPHRPRAEGYSDRHRARSSNYSLFMSFITCYHFGYHWEHHQYPHLPWYKLPSAR